MIEKKLYKDLHTPDTLQSVNPKMQNQAAVEALYSATFVEDYLDCVENLPNDLQRHLSRLREFDLTQYSVSIHFAIKQDKSFGSCKKFGIPLL